MRLLLFLLLGCLALLKAQDEFTPTGLYNPNFFAELLDVEVYSDDLIYTFGVGGFVFLDISSSNNPKKLGRYDPGNIYTQRFYNAKAAGNLAIAAARSAGLYLLDIKDKRNPGLISIHGSSGLSYESVEFRAGRAYAAVHEAGLEVISIKNTSAPQTVRLVSGRNNAWDVFIDGDFLYLADGTAGLTIFSLADPDTPRLVGSLKGSGSAKEVIVQNGLAYLALGAAGVDIVDVSDPARPVLIANYNSGFGIVNHLDVEGDVLYAATWEMVLAVDVSNPARPVLLATEDTPTRAMGLAAHNGEVFVSDWLDVRRYEFQSSGQPDIHVKPATYDFGFQGIDVPVEKEFEIFNLGEKPLDVTSISSTNSLFSFSRQQLSIPARGVERITVSFTPQQQTSVNSRFVIESNDIDEASKQVRVFGGVARLSPGDPAPTFTLEDIQKRVHSLSEQRGKIVILAFFASW